MLYCSIYFFKRGFFDLLFFIICVGGMRAFKPNLKAQLKWGSVFGDAAENTISVGC